MDAQLWFHNPESVSLEGYLKIETEFEERDQLRLPKLKLSVRCQFKAQCKAEFDYVRINKGTSATGFFKVISLGINSIFTREATMKIDSPQFVVEIIGEKKMFEPRQPPNVEISKKAAKKLLEDINTMKAMQQLLNYKDDLEMLENKIEASLDECNEEKNQEILQESVENANECVDDGLKTSQLLDTLEDCDSL